MGGARPNVVRRQPVRRRRSRGTGPGAGQSSVPTSRTPQRLLRYTVDRALAGEKDALKEAVIAIEGLGKSAAHDPKVDPSVRVIAGRVKKRLKEYYDSGGASDPVTIEFPQTGYVPSFRVASPDQARTPAPVRRRPYWRFAAAAAVIAAIALAVSFWILSSTRRSNDLAAMSGRWVAEMKGAESKYPMVLDLDTQGPFVVGTVQFPAGNGTITDSQFRGRTLVFTTSHKTDFSDEPFTTRFTAELEQNSLHLIATSSSGIERGIGHRVSH